MRTRTMPAGARKYGNIPTEYQGRTYASKAEAARAAELTQLRKIDVIAYWMAQPAVDLAGIRYRPDFIVWDNAGGVWYEDVKGCETQRFRDICALWVTSGPPCRLRILKRKGDRWSVQDLMRGGMGA